MIIFFISLGLIFSFFILYPLLLIFFVYILKKVSLVEKKYILNDDLPNLSVLIVARNAKDFVGDKILNTFDLDYPENKLEILFFSDGSTDDTLNIVNSLKYKAGLKIYSSEEHIGKITALNRLVPEAKGDILVFTDVDAILDTNILHEIVANFNDEKIGGVCGKRVILKKDKGLEDAQRKYFAFSTFLQQLESKIDSITSNEGKLYAIKRELFKPILNATTDDLFVCLSIISQHYRFIFDISLKAYIPIPSRSLKHEIIRRRRIVSTSLRGIFYHYKLFNCFKYGIFSFNLFFSKVLRRFIPFAIIGVFITNLYLLNVCIFFKFLFILQILFYFFPLLSLFFKKSSFVKKISNIIVYFMVGNLGTLLGVIDYVTGKKIDKWEPEKVKLK